MDEREYRRRIRRNRIAQEEKKRIRQQLRQTMVVCALACVMLLVCCLWSAEPTYAKTNAATASGSCAVQRPSHQDGAGTGRGRRIRFRIRRFGRP